MRLIVTGVFLLLAAAVTADESSVYESVHDLSIGPVFLTPAERRWLDANRHLAPRDVSAQPDAVEAGDYDSASEAVPAGFIINSSGQTRHYRDGDFALSASSPDSMSFPDDVEIRRHPPERVTDAEGPDEDGPADETSDD